MGAGNFPGIERVPEKRFTLEKAVERTAKNTKNAEKAGFEATAAACRRSPQR